MSLGKQFVIKALRQTYYQRNTVYEKKTTFHLMRIYFIDYTLFFKFKTQ